jgi:hypothetical protein
MSPDVNVVGPPPRKPWYILSVDLGQTIDPTAIAVVERVLPPPVGFYFDDDGREIEAPFTGRPTYHATWLERLPLGTSYVAGVARVRSMLARPPLLGHCDLVIDRTGVGRAVYDLFVEAGLDPIGITITGGDNEHRETDRSGWRVSKLALVSRLQALLHAGELKIAKSLPEAPALAAELQDFRATISESGNASFGARSGRHDDLVLALACATWWAARNEGNQVSIRYGLFA